MYVYLVRYAEEQQDLALLSIATFQRGLKVRFFSVAQAKFWELYIIYELEWIKCALKNQP